MVAWRQPKESVSLGQSARFQATEERANCSGSFTLPLDESSGGTRFQWRGDRANN